MILTMMLITLIAFLHLILSSAELVPISFHEVSLPVPLQPLSTPDCVPTIATTPSVRANRVKWRDDFFYPIWVCSRVSGVAYNHTCPSLPYTRRYTLILEGIGKPIEILQAYPIHELETFKDGTLCAKFDHCGANVLDKIPSHINLRDISLRGRVEEYNRAKSGFKSELTVSIRGGGVSVISSGAPKPFDETVKDLSVEPVGFLCNSIKDCRVNNVPAVKGLQRHECRPYRSTPDLTLINFWKNYTSPEDSNLSFTIKAIPEDCRPKDGVEDYNPELAEKMLRLASIAYDQNDPQRCAQKLFGSWMHLTLVATRSDYSGYLGYSTWEKAIIVSFRGSKDLKQVQDIASSHRLPATDFQGMGPVQQYYKKAFEALWPSMKPEVMRLQKCYPEYNIWVTGHSLGGAIASLATASIILDRMIPSSRLVSYSFGMPRVGKFTYACNFNKLLSNRWRVTNKGDFVTVLPPQLLESSDPAYHHGVEAYYDNNKANASSSHKQCLGYPYGEDPTCSFLGCRFIKERHTKYFGIEVGSHCDKIRKTSGNHLDFSTNETTVFSVQDDGSYVKRLPHELRFFDDCTKTITTAPEKSEIIPSSGTAIKSRPFSLLFVFLLLLTRH